MSDSTNFLRELLELDERQDATNVEPQVTSSPVSDPPPPQPATTLTCVVFLTKSIIKQPFPLNHSRK